MRVSVVCADSTISVNGVGRICAFDLPEGVRAIQWDGAVGYFERRRSAGGGLEFFDDPTVIAPYVAAWSNAPEISLRVEAPGIPEDCEWLEGTMPGGRDVRFTEVLNVDPPGPTPPPPEPDASVPDASGAGGGGSDILGVSGGPGIMLTVDQRRAELADALSMEYQARIPPARDKRGEANAEIVRLSNLPERSDEDIARLNELHNDVRGLDDYMFRLAEHLAAMQGALFHKGEIELAAFDPAYDWPSLSVSA